MAVKVAAVFLDNALADPRPAHVEFVHDGLWYESLDMAITHYATQYRGGIRNLDADRLQLLSCAMIQVEDQK